MTKYGSTASTTPTAFTATASTVALAANGNRTEAYIKNDSDKDAYVLFGAGTVSATVYTDVVKANGGRMRTDFRGVITMKMAAAIGSGQCLVSEIT